MSESDQSRRALRTSPLMKSLIRKYQRATLFIGFVSEKMENFLMLYIPLAKLYQIVSLSFVSPTAAVPIQKHQKTNA